MVVVHGGDAALLCVGRDGDEGDSRAVPEEVDGLDVARVVVAAPSSVVMKIAVWAHSFASDWTCLIRFCRKNSYRPGVESAGWPARASKGRTNETDGSVPPCTSSRKAL